METKHLLDMAVDELAAELGQLGEPGFRARQVMEWVWRKGMADFAGMTNLSAELRGRLADRLRIFAGKVAARRDAPDGVIKLLIEWPDGERVETVLIPAEGRRSACVSTQAGCAVGCEFCASGLGGLARDLSCGEIVEQVLQLRAARGERISHVVLMGMGEPLANYNAAVSAVRALIDPRRGGLSARHVTLSTVGLPAAIRRLAEEEIPLNLAVSLHAPNDELRRRLIPTASLVRIADLVAAGRDWFDRTGRELTLEYVLLEGVNDSTACADELAAVARRLRCNVNLIRFNAAPDLRFRRPAERTVRAFRDRLREAGVNVQVRASRGAEAEAACGQLRRR